MARSLFSILGHRLRAEECLSRREMLKLSAAASAGLLISAYGLARPARPSMDAPHVLIIGAGLAGLVCAYELRAVGCRVTVFEARQRAGGRVVTHRHVAPGCRIEGGGEFIGANHPLWLHYAQRFNLEMREVTEDEEAEVIVEINGRRLTQADAEDLYESLESAVEPLNDLARQVNLDQPWASEHAAELDRRSIGHWIDECDSDERTRHMLHMLFAADNGMATSQQSLLGFLAMVGGGGYEAYWTESETYRCDSGNAMLARMLVNAIGIEHVRQGHPVMHVAVVEDGVVVTTEQEQSFEGDEVVLATPPSTWRNIRIDPGLPEALDSIQMGRNIKQIMPIKERSWQAGGVSQYVITDSEVQLVWDPTDGQDLDHAAALTIFAGADAADRWSAMPADERERHAMRRLEGFFPGVEQSRLGQAMFMDWTNDPRSLGSYSFPAPGQLTRCGALLRDGLERLHFAGEHVSVRYPGYMEGALESGAMVARRIATRAGLAPG